MGIDASQLGSGSCAEEFRVGSTRLGQFAAAVNDTNRARPEGCWATPVFVSVPPKQPVIGALRLVRSHPEILEVAVIPVLDEPRGEEVNAYIS